MNIEGIKHINLKGKLFFPTFVSVERERERERERGREEQG
jgi:hypothetical protein